VRHLAGPGQAPRRVLQEVGQRAVEEGARIFLERFLDWASFDGEGPLVIDGLRHAAVYDELHRWARERQRPFVTVLVSVDEAERAARLTGGDVEALRTIDSHRVEAQASGLLTTLADVVARRPWVLSELLEVVRIAADGQGRAHP